MYRTAFLLAGLCLAWLVAAPAGADEAKKRYPKAPDANVPIIPAAWKDAPKSPATPAEIDRLLEQHLKADKLTASPRVTDEQFVRRVYLDLTGKVPTAAQSEAFVKDSDPQKRARLIDALLASEAFSRHLAKHWRDVMLSRATSSLVFIRFPRQSALEQWLFEQFQAKKSWGEISRDLLTAEGGLKLTEPTKNGQVGFLMAHAQADAAVERASDTARVFLGIQIQCAQCHDHPSDIWKRQQFHELTAFFGKLAERPVFAEPQGQGQQRRIEGFRLAARPFGEYRMPDRDDPKKTYAVQPRFLTGDAPPPARTDLDRRKALAKFVTAPDNYWFSAAFANRVWGDLTGQGFYQPVDNMGPLQEATYPDVLFRLAASFRATDYDIRGLYRLVMNTEAYQRQSRVGDSPGDHLRCTARYPTRMSADELWDAVASALGPFPQGPGRGRPGPGGGGPFRRQFGLAFQFRQLFDFDPSIKPDEVEGSVPQALMLMNNQQLNARMKATGDTPLARVLKDHPQDDKAIEQVYLRTLGRKPTPREMRRCREHVKQVGKRAEAFEDILWALVNSTEFQTKR